jgi:hypothetical protein
LPSADTSYERGGYGVEYLASNTFAGLPAVNVDPDVWTGTAVSDVVLDPPGPGNNTAFGHCSLALGVCTFSGGTGEFTWFQASVDVAPNDDFSLWYWDGTFSFSPRD